ncbi:hypothetical protein KUTeg_021286 [Tegillarca granosa]|uniref:Uncharacterized protein n=1 Tax=Tegillarca granosa TaxID=220873 RepID=A0ABQ9EAC5_TEGGR|nr:hypothetical protein KUTeg_021286 [Tegillarca granosa]
MIIVGNLTVRSVRHYTMYRLYTDGILMSFVKVHPRDPDFPTYKDSGPLVGFHGYDNLDQEMGAIFVGIGPDFKVNYGAKPFANVNLYQLMCHLLGLTPAPNNGTWSTVSDMLVDWNSPNGAVNPLPNIIIFISFFITLSVMLKLTNIANINDMK